MVSSDDIYIWEIPSLQSKFISFALHDSEFFVVTLHPLGYFGIISYFMFGDIKVQKICQIS